MRYFDAHNHLQDERFGDSAARRLAEAAAVGVARMVVNGSCEEDWPRVLALARAHPQVLPSLGYHPWYVGERTADWEQALARALEATPGAAVGEIGLDRWKPGLSYEGQEEVFTTQLRLATELQRPASIHCLQAWGRLHELLRAAPPPRGFLLHSYGGSAEMIPDFARLGGYFSFPGYFAHARKARQRETFRQVPMDRLLIETDAPDQPLPEELNAHPLADAAGRPLNHPANLPAVCRVVAELRGVSVEEMATRLEENFQRLFG